MGTVGTEQQVDVVLAGGGATGLMTALRAAANPDLVVAVFEKSTGRDATPPSPAAASPPGHPFPGRGRDL